LTSGHSDDQDWASECPDVKNYKWRLNPVWHRMHYSCTRMATVGFKGLILIDVEWTDGPTDTMRCIMRRRCWTAACSRILSGGMRDRHTTLASSTWPGVNFTRH